MDGSRPGSSRYEAHLHPTSDLAYDVNIIQQIKEYCCTKADKKKNVSERQEDVRNPVEVSVDLSV